MPFLTDDDSIQQYQPAAPETPVAPYGQQFLRGLGHSITFGLWEPFHEAGTGGLPETLGKIAGAATMFAPVVRGVGLGTAAAGRFLPKLLAEGVSAGQAAGRMGQLGRQVGPSFSSLGSGLTVGAAVPLQSELEALGDQSRGVTPPPLSQRLLTDVIGAGLGAYGGRALSRQAGSKLAAGPAGAAASSLATADIVQLLDKDISLIKQKLAVGGAGEDVNKLNKLLADKINQRDIIAKTIPPSETAGAAEGDRFTPPTRQEVEAAGQDAYSGTGVLKTGADEGSVLRPMNEGVVTPPSYADWLKAKAGGEAEMGATAGKEAAPSLGTWMKENLSPEHLFGAEYAESLGASVRPPEAGQSYQDWLRESLQALKKPGIVTSGIDDAALLLGRQLSDQGQRGSSALGEAVHTIDNPGVPPISGGAGGIAGYPTEQILRPGPAASLRSAMGWLERNGIRFMQIVPIRALLADTPAAALPDAMGLASMRMKSARIELWDKIPAVSTWNKETEQKVRKLWQEYAKRSPEEFAEAIRQNIPEAAEGVGQLQKVFGDIWSRLVYDGVLEPEQRVLNYFPLVRERLTAQATGLQLVERNAGYRPRELENILAGFDPQFAKTRTWGGPEDFAVNVPMRKVLNMYFTQFTRHAVIDDMKDELQQLLSVVPNDYKAQMAEHVNFWLGRDAPTISRFNARLRDYNFIRAIGMNVMSPIMNLMQTINTFSVSSHDSFFKAFADMRDPARLKFLTDHGLGSLLDRRGNLEDLMWESGGPEIGGLVRKVRDFSGRMFESSERFNRVHALMTGLREAERKGIQGADEQFKFAWSLMTQTQFDLGAQSANLPVAFRSSTGRLVGQFQTFRLNQMHFMVRLLDQARHGAMSGDPKQMLEGMLPFVKFWSPALALSGSMGVIPGDWGEDTVTRALFGKAMHIPGLAELLFGVAVPSGLGLGTINANDLNSFISYFPGPSIGLIQGLAGAATGKNFGYGLDFSQVGQPLSKEQQLHLGVSSLPFGVQSNRVLQMLRLLRTDGNYQRSLDLTEFLGLDRPMGPVISQHAISLEKVLLGAGGYQPVERGQDFRRFQQETQIQDEMRTAVHRAGELWAAGKPDQAQALIDQFNSRWQQQLPAPLPGVTSDAIRNAMKAQILSPEQRRKLPRALRGLDLTPPAYQGANP